MLHSSLLCHIHIDKCSLLMSVLIFVWNVGVFDDYTHTNTQKTQTAFMFPCIYHTHAHTHQHLHQLFVDVCVCVCVFFINSVCVA